MTRRRRWLVEYRRKTVDHRTALTKQLTDLLKTYFPQALEGAGDLRKPAAGEFLETGPSLQALRGAPRSEGREFYRRPRRRWGEELEKLLQEIGQARALTEDPALVEASALMTQTLVAPWRAVIAALARLDKAREELFGQHPDQPIFGSLPGAGEALGPRRAAAFGTDRHRYPSAEEMQPFSGLAPVTESSGKMHGVQGRLACPKFLRQRFHEFAAGSRNQSLWAQAYYERRRQQGGSHHAAIRALAYKWIRILYPCWKTHTPDDESVYRQALRRRPSPLWLATKSLPSQEAKA